MSDAVSAIGSAAVTTVGTVAVAGMAMKAVGKATGGMSRGGGGHKKNYNVWHHGKKSSKHKSSSKSMLGW